MTTSINPGLLTNAILVEPPQNLPEWLLAEIPAFFKDIADAEDFIQECSVHIAMINAQIESAAELERIGIESPIKKLLGARVKYRQMISIARASIKKAHPNYQIEDQLEGGCDREIKALRQEIGSLREKIGELSSKVHLSVNESRSVTANFKKEKEARIKLEARLVSIRAAIVRVLYALLSNDAKEKQRAIEMLSFVPECLEKYSDWGEEI